MQVPQTSTTLLLDVADSQNVRWAVFCARYEPMMRSFLRAHFPSLDADDIIQETFIALTKVLPNYHYDPQENGYFHNYLTGILRNKALRELAACQRDARLKERVAEEDTGVGLSWDENESRKWREAVYEIALQQLLADQSIYERSKQIFTRLTLGHEAPQKVADSLGVPYATVVKVKERMLKRLRASIKAMKNV